MQLGELAWSDLLGLVPVEQVHEPVAADAERYAELGARFAEHHATLADFHRTLPQHP
ncbi:MAG: hypothetical protein R2705_18935 [Ilumatobacteraceae bacterium]